MFGFGVRTGEVFASRWKALLWSAGILLTAYCTVPAATSDDVEPPGKGATAAADAAGLTQQQKDDADAAIRALTGSQN